MRVSPELIQVSTGSTKWQEPFDAALTDVFKVQADVAGQVAQALDLALGTPQRAALAARPTGNAAAYDAYLKGEAASQTMGTGDPLRLRSAIGFYEQAVALDSGFAQAWAELSRAHSLLYANGTPDPASARRAREGADRALRLAPNQPVGHLALGDYYASIPPDQEQARLAYEAGLRISPNDAELLGASALVEISTGKWEEALQHFSRAQALDPRSLAVARRLAYTLLRLRRYPEALAASDRALALVPDNVQVLENKAMVFLGQGDLEGARRVIREAPPSIDPTVLAAYFGNYYELYWLLPPEQQALLLRLTPSAFTDRASWAIVLAQTYRLQGDRPQDAGLLRTPPASRSKGGWPAPRTTRRATSSAGSPSPIWAARPRRSPKASEASPCCRSSKDTYTGPYLQHQLVRIYIETGEFGEGAGLARASAPDALQSVARLAPDRSDLRSAAEQPAVPEAGGGNGVGRGCRTPGAGGRPRADAAGSRGTPGRADAARDARSRVGRWHPAGGAQPAGPIHIQPTAPGGGESVA